MTADSDVVIPRDERGHFLPGGPGGPGRPKGLTRAEQAARLLEPRREELIGKTIEYALAGDAQMMKLALERIAPIARPEGERVLVPGLAEAKTVSDKARAVVDAVAAGEITAESGRSVLQMLDLLSRAVKLDELERRLAAIEQGRQERVVNHNDASDLV